MATVETLTPPRPGVVEVKLSVADVDALTDGDTIEIPNGRYIIRLVAEPIPQNYLDPL
jgi:hypothetical protein